MTRYQSPDGTPTQQVVDYNSRRAASEVGLIRSEGMVIARPAFKNMKDIPDFNLKLIKYLIETGSVGDTNFQR